MSKSHENPMSRILITDSRDEIFAKLKAALTDSVTGVTYDPTNRPGVSNLVEIMFHLEDTGSSSCEELAAECNSLSMRALKEKVADCVDKHLAPIRDRYEMIVQDGKYLSDVADAGARSASASAAATMELVKDAMGVWNGGRRFAERLQQRKL